MRNAHSAGRAFHSASIFVARFRFNSSVHKRQLGSIALASALHTVSTGGYTTMTV